LFIAHFSDQAGVSLANAISASGHLRFLSAGIFTYRIFHPQLTTREVLRLLLLLLLLLPLLGYVSIWPEKEVYAVTVSARSGEANGSQQTMAKLMSCRIE